MLSLISQEYARNHRCKIGRGEVPNNSYYQCCLLSVTFDHVRWQSKRVHSIQGQEKQQEVRAGAGGRCVESLAKKLTLQGCFSAYVHRWDQRETVIGAPVGFMTCTRRPWEEVLPRRSSNRQVSIFLFHLYKVPPGHCLAHRSRDKYVLGVNLSTARATSSLGLITHKPTNVLLLLLHTL